MYAQGRLTHPVGPGAKLKKKSLTLKFVTNLREAHFCATEKIMQVKGRIRYGSGT